jgi:hypothetical protein
MSDTAEGTGKERDEKLSALAQDVSHPFDQTNGIVEGLEGNEDEPDQVDSRMNKDGEAAVFGTAPGVGAAVPIGIRRHSDDEEVDTDYPEGP